jgi:hypothetical protein
VVVVHSERASYRNLETCASVHVCPICGAKVAEHRRQELGAATAAWLDQGGGLLLATLTLQHSLGDKLADVAGALNGAYRFVKAGEMWKRFADGVGLVGSVAATEYTHGGAGWHPHKHALLFTAAPLTDAQVGAASAWLKERWSRAVAKRGRYASALHGCDVRPATAADVAAYVTKATGTWTVSDELTRSGRKMGRAGGRSPMQILSDAGAGDERSGVLFREYAEWTYRKNHLVWSRGLRGLLGLAAEEESDEEIAAAADDDERIVLSLDRDTWRVIVSRGLRADVLLAVEDDGGAGPVDAVANLLRRYGIVIKNWDTLRAELRVFGQAVV